MALGESALYTNPGIYFAGNCRFGNLSVLMALIQFPRLGRAFPGVISFRFSILPSRRLGVCLISKPAKNARALC
jgi:hypothetical protein